MAAQLMATNGPLARGESWCSARDEQLLAGAALAEQQHGGVGGRRALDGEQRLLEGGVLAQHAGQPEAPLVVLLQQDVVR